MATDWDWQIEGKARFQVGPAFYRPHSQLARDLGVLAAALYHRETGSLRVLDAMAGSGVRSLRYWLESQADWVWTNEANPDLTSLLQSNLREAIASGVCHLTCTDATRAFFTCYLQRDYYDWVDVDGFGSAVPELEASLGAVKLGGLLYLTNTDGRTVTGHLPEQGLSTYGVFARNHPAAHEQGLRILIGKAQQQAAAKGFGIEPVFALFAGETYRVLLRLVRKSALTAENYGFLGYCHHCGDYQPVSWRRLGRAPCPHDGEPLTLSGPMWLGPLHDRPFVERLATLADDWNWLTRSPLLRLMAAEADLPPYFYLLGEIGRRGKTDIPKRSHLIQALQALGYRASPTHIHAEAIKTEARLSVCIQAAQALQQK